MRQRSRLLPAFIVALTAAPLIVLGPATVASADPIPPTNYTPVTLTDIPGARQVLTDTNGGATVGCGTSSATTVFKSFNASGTQTQNLAPGTSPSTSTYGDLCPTDSVVGRDGTVFLYAQTNNFYTNLVQAWKNDSLVWQYTIPCGSSTAVAAMTVGRDGNVYVGVRGGTSPCGPTQLIGLTPTAQTGTTTPQVVMNQTIWGGSLSFGGLAAYHDGLVLHKGNEVQYVSYNGTVGDAVSYTRATASSGYGERFDATLSGTVFLANRATPGASTGCDSPNDMAGSISAFAPSGSVWTTSLEGCTYVQNLRPIHSGGVVMYARWRPETGGELQNKLMAFDRNGLPLWTSMLDDTGLDPTYNGAAIAVDMNGNVAVQRGVMVGKYINGSYWRFPEIQFAVLSGNTGAAIQGTSFALRGDSTTTSGPSYLWADYEVRIGKSTAYVVATQCTTSSYCDQSTRKLYAFKIPGLMTDYPRGAILQADVPWDEYVAMGDSFSSGQGVTPYETGTDTAGPPENRCRRSHAAYAKLLDDAPGARLNLTAFVACGGATTEDVRLGRFNEDPQIDALSTSTDVSTITIGGNNIGFGPLGLACLAQLDCTQSTEYANAADILGNDLPGDLDTLFSAIAAKTSAETRVLVVGYPLLVPEANTPTTWPNCLYLSSSEKTALRGIITDLNQALHDAADRAGDRFEYVDVNYEQSPFKGHELCNDGSYFYGADSGGTAAFHPIDAGQDAYHQVIARYLG